MAELSAPVNQDHRGVILDVPVDVLCSYYYFTDVDMSVLAGWGCRIIGDSGAFSAMTSGNPIDLRAFHEWAARWQDDLLWVAALDKIGDLKQTRANWEAARSDGLALVPTLHFGEPATELDWYVEQGADLIGLGGMVAYSSEPARLMRWLIPMFKRARDHYPHVRFHGWGISHPRLVDQLPWWSTDSSGFASAFRYGSLRLFDPRRGKYFQVDLDGRSVARHRDLLRRYYGVERWQDMAVSTGATRRLVGRVAIRAVQLYAQWLQARQRVTPPESLIPKLINATAGPVQSAAVGSDVSPFTPGPLQSAVHTPTGALNPALNPTGSNARAAPMQSISMGKAASSQLQVINPDNVMSVGPRSAAAATTYTSPALTDSLGPTQAAVLGAGGNTSAQAFLAKED